jgi:hypothetical protein
MLFNRRLLNSGAAGKTIGNHRTYLKMFWRYATSNGINGDRNMIRDAFDYKVETGTGKRNFTPTEALAILSAARQETDPLLRWAPLVMHTPAAGSVSCWARPRLPSNSATGFGVWWAITGRAIPGSGAGYRHPSPSILKVAADKLHYALG